MFGLLFTLIVIVFVVCYLYHTIIDYLTIFNELSDTNQLDSVYMFIATTKLKYNKEFFLSPFKGMKELIMDIFKGVKGWVEKETY